MKSIVDLSVTSAPFRARGAWSPGQLFDGGTQGAWYDPSDRSTLFQDVAGTVPVAVDGDPVALMRDKSGNGNDAQQSTASARPTWRTDGTLSWIEFDGTDDRLAVNGYALSQPDLTICAGLLHEPGGVAWAAIKSRAAIGVYVGLSHPTATGPVSNSGGQMTVNRVAAPADRIDLRNALLAPSVATVRDAQSSQFDQQDCEIVSYGGTSPPAAKLFSYIELTGAPPSAVPRIEQWIAAKTGVTL